MSDAVSRDDALDALHEEIARLGAENEQLRGPDRVQGETAVKNVDPARPVRVLLLPDPLRTTESGRPGPEVAANVARVLISQLHDRQPGIDWRAEHDLERIPHDAECFQIGEVLRRLWDGSDPLPKTYRVEQDQSGERHVRRCLVAGEAESDRFRAGYERQLRIVDDLLAEGQAAYAAGALHHANWTLKAVDVVLARAALALARFQAGQDDWRAELDTPRAEYDPRYRIAAEHPPGW